MCIVFLAHGIDDETDLTILANRDEFRERPAAAMQRWSDPPSILAGRDLLSGGTWMGFGADHSLALVTNYRDMRFKDFVGPSRGELVTRFFENQADSDAFSLLLEQYGRDYAGFNIIYGRPGDLYFFSNVEQVVRPIGKGIFGLSNAVFDTPWPKVERGKELLRGLVESSAIVATEQLFSILADQHRPAEEDLPDTGVGLEWERFLSPIFINGDDYGSRCSTLAIWRKGLLQTVQERTFSGAPDDFSEVRFSF